MKSKTQSEEFISYDFGRGSITIYSAPDVQKHYDKNEHQFSYEVLYKDSNESTLLKNITDLKTLVQRRQINLHDAIKPFTEEFCITLSFLVKIGNVVNGSFRYDYLDEWYDLDKSKRSPYLENNKVGFITADFTLPSPPVVRLKKYFFHIDSFQLEEEPLPPKKG
jgi:hypothetical protein